MLNSNSPIDILFTTRSTEILCSAHRRHLYILGTDPCPTSDFCPYTAINCLIFYNQDSVFTVQYELNL